MKLLLKLVLIVFCVNTIAAVKYYDARPGTNFTDDIAPEDVLIIKITTFPGTIVYKDGEGDLDTECINTKNYMLNKRNAFNQFATYVPYDSKSGEIKLTITNTNKHRERTVIIYTISAPSSVNDEEKVPDIVYDYTDVELLLKSTKTFCKDVGKHSKHISQSVYKNHIKPIGHDPLVKSVKHTVNNASNQAYKSQKKFFKKKRKFRF